MFIFSYFCKKFESHFLVKRNSLVVSINSNKPTSLIFIKFQTVTYN